MINAFLFKKNEFISFVLMFFMVMSSSFISYDYFNFLKIIVLVISVFILLKYFNIKNFVSEKKFLCFLVYAVALILFFLRDSDSFSLRIVFNLIVTLLCAAAVISIGLYRKHMLFLMPLVVFFSIYNYFFNINHYDGKPQVHAQVFTLVAMSIATYGFSSNRIINAILLIFVFLSKVRSVLFGIIPIVIINISGVNKRHTDFLNFMAAALACFLFYYIYNNFDSLYLLLGDSLNSMSWRFYHWNNLFKDTSDMQMLFGGGLGHSWRTSLFIDDFYTDGENYIAAHSNYVKILSETGYAGLIAFISMIAYFYRNSAPEAKSLLTFYIGYGFYDEGVWLYSIFWTLVMISDKRIRND